MVKNPVTIIGMPIHLGQGLDGVDLGPQAIRYASLCKALYNMGYVVKDSGDLPRCDRDETSVENPLLRYLKAITLSNTLLADKVAEVVSRGEFPLLLGGDHSMAIGTIAGLRKQYNRLGVLWIDAHGDLNTPETTPTGNIHGMSLAVSLGIGHPDLVQLGGVYPKISPDRTVLIGARDIDAGERKLIKELGIHVYTSHDIERFGIPAIMDQAIQIVRDGTDGVHVSFDVDSLDPQVIMGTGTRVPGGITYREGQLLLRILAEANIVTSAEFVEVNPLLDEKNKTAELTVGLICSLLGEGLTNCFEVSEMVEAP